MYVPAEGEREREERYINWGKIISRLEDEEEEEVEENHSFIGPN